MLRPLRYVSFLFFGLLATGCAAQAPTGSPEPAADARQIHWQRSVDDALALARAEQRPILVALNMDGESASDRIVHEEYRDPAFVAASRRCVCLVGSLFRHNPQDYDEHGRRIPCPRLGCCTCGEHIALEPLLYERFLADGERVAPRHAVILPDGSKAWDLSLSFDLRDIDRALIATAANAPPVAGGVAVRGDWNALAAGRSHRLRQGLERAIAAAPDERALTAAMSAIASHGDRGSLDALRLVAVRLPGLSSALRQPFEDAVAALGLATPAGTVLRELVQTIGPLPGAVATTDPVWLDVLAAVDGVGDATRGFLLACRAAGYDGAEAALQRAFGDGAAAIEAAIAAAGGPCDWREVLQAAARTRRAAAGAPPQPGYAGDDMPSADELLAELDALDGQRRERPDDLELRARAAKASLDLARRHLETGGSDVPLLLTDAEQGYRRVLEAEPDRTVWWIERARTAYFQSRFADEMAFGRDALRAATGGSAETVGLGDPRGGQRDELAVEALRWIGDGAARSFGAELATDPAAAAARITAGLRAFAAVTTSPFGHDKDWSGFASFCGAAGLWREQFAIADAGVRRLPGGGLLRQCLVQSLWAGGAATRVAAVADDVLLELDPAGADGPYADALWYAGYAWMLRAEQQRRARTEDAALASYEVARARFAASVAQNAGYAASCAFQTALCWLGSGLAHAQAGRRQDAAEALVEAVASHATLAGASDGLGYDVLDLVDKIGEWRASGPSPVDPLALLERLDAIAPDTPFYAVALADSQLREALRADGRNPERAERLTVDAAGEPIVMSMGLPNDEGDGYLRASLALLHRAADRLVSDEDRKALAQSDTIWVERNLERGRSEGVYDALVEAAGLLGTPVPGRDADPATLETAAAALRAALGEARPRWRMGR